MCNCDGALGLRPKPYPVCAALGRMREAHRSAMAWLEKAGPALDEELSVSLALLEGLVNEGSRLPVVMPQTKGLRERLVAARKLADKVRGESEGHIACPAICVCSSLVLTTVSTGEW